MKRIIQAIHAELENDAWVQCEQLSWVRQTEQWPAVEPNTRVYLRKKKIRDFSLLSYFFTVICFPHSIRFTTSWLPIREITADLEGWAESHFGFCWATTHTPQSSVLLGQGTWVLSSIYLHTSPWTLPFWRLPGFLLQTGISLHTAFLSLNPLLLSMNLDFCPLFSAQIPLFSKSK